MNRIDKLLASRRDTSSKVRSAELFTAAGYSPEAAAAIVHIDATMQRIRRSIAKREFVAEILRKMDGGIDLQLLDVMGAVSHWFPENLKDADREVTVGTVAARLGIDPSRASRLVSELVDKGYIRRVASQADSRRIVLEATEKGWAFGEEFRRRKGDTLIRALRSWTEDELVTFSRLLERYSHWTKEGLQPAVDEE
jgi:DNA-binding MarR family transcriptional regulator